MAQPNNPPLTSIRSAAPKPPSVSATSKSSPPKIEHKLQPQQAMDTFQESELHPPIAHFVINLVLQIAAFAAAIAFGIFAVKSVQEAIVANGLAKEALDLSHTAQYMTQKSLEVANTANRLALLTFCQSPESMTKDITSLCELVVRRANTTLPSIISNVFPSATPTVEGTPRPSGAGQGAGQGASSIIIGIVVGVVLAMLVIGLGGWAIARRHKRNHARRESSVEKSIPGLPISKRSTFRTLFVDTRVISRRREVM